MSIIYAWRGASSGTDLACVRHALETKNKGFNMIAFIKKR
jgi:hypothetical protein